VAAGFAAQTAGRKALKERSQSMDLTRRKMALLVSALAAADAHAQRPRLATKMYLYDDLPVRANGENRSRALFDGSTHTGFTVEMHETELAPGLMPHAAHKHLHEEMVIVREGTIEVTVEGKNTTLGPGSVAYVASNQEHGWRNVGTTRAKYFILTLGKG
jgi:quercetin dioxygenase-like cupin family protein